MAVVAKPNVYQRGNRWVCSVRWKCPASGKTQTISQTEDSQKDAEDFGAVTARQIERAIKSGTYNLADFKGTKKPSANIVRNDDGEMPSLGDCLRLYLVQVFASNYKESYKLSERKRVNFWLKHPLTSMKINEITFRDIAKVRNEFRNLGRAETTIHNQFTCISKTFTDAQSPLSEMRVHYPAIPETLNNPVQMLRDMAKGRNGDKNAGIADLSRHQHRETRLTDEQLERLYEILKGINLEAGCAFRLAIETGMRAGTMYSVRVSWINFEDKCIYIPKGVDKNRQARAVALTNRAIEAIREILENPNRPRVIGKKVKRFVESDMLFTTSHAGNYRHFKNARDILAEEDPSFATKLKDERFTFHDLKHEAVSRLIEVGIPAMLVMQQVGNKTMSSFQRYTNIKNEPVIEAISLAETKIDERIEKRKAKFRSSVRKKMNVREVLQNGFKKYGIVVRKHTE